MDFWTAYLTLAIAFAGALGAMTKGAPDLFKEIRPLLISASNYLWGAAVGAAIGSQIVEINIREAVDLTAVKDLHALNQALPLAAKAFAVAITFSVCVWCACAADDFWCRSRSKGSRDRNQTDENPPADPESRA